MKLLKNILSSNEQKIFHITIKPYAIYSIINIFFMYLSSKNVGTLNEDTASGLFISWVMFTMVMLFCISFSTDK